MNTQDLARIVPWPKTALRCQIHTCRHTADYMIRHKQGMFADKHFLICADCAESILRNLPPELQATPVPEVDVLDLIKALTRSAEIQALSKGQDAPEELRKALGELLDLLAEAGTEVEAPIPYALTTVSLPEAESRERWPQDDGTAVPPKSPATTGGTTYVCAECGATFPSKAALNGHMMSHKKRGAKR